MKRGVRFDFADLGFEGFIFFARSLNSSRFRSIPRIDFEDYLFDWAEGLCVDFHFQTTLFSPSSTHSLLPSSYPKHERNMSLPLSPLLCLVYPGIGVFFSARLCSYSSSHSFRI